MLEEGNIADVRDEIGCISLPRGIEAESRTHIAESRTHAVSQARFRRLWKANLSAYRPS
jgi:hypothetical protein